MIGVAVSAKVVVRSNHVRLHATNDAHEMFGRVVKVGGAVMVVAAWILVPRIADHARVAEAEVLKVRHTKGGHRRSDFAHAGFAKAFVRFGGVPLRDDDLAELAQARALAVQRYLIDEGQLEPKRIFLKKPDITAAPEEETTYRARVELGAAVR